MKSTKLALTIVCCLTSSFFARRVSAQTELPAIVSSGLDAYQKTDSKAAVAAWLKTSALYGDESKTKLNDTLSQMQTDYGKMVGYETIQLVTLAPSMQRAYVLIKFEKAPLYAMFECYKSPGGWIIIYYRFNTKADTVLPPNILDGSGK